MSLKLVEVVVLGQVLRLNVPAEQEEILRQAARNLDPVSYTHLMYLSHNRQQEQYQHQIQRHR